ncbi:hypothetical protein BJ973_004884 [Actinoplanes tereljensis]|uniref:Inhibitor I9 domain-containing protein n=1 Tax=Paractinoplanes tereljensis TaxID=571912 RepID=A0A919NQ99_9ACTN|nr:hypothetical protein Ate02nite_44020 [Actinoplanes tereljensis]
MTLRLPVRRIVAVGLFAALVTTLAGTPVSAAPTGEIRYAGSPTAIAGSYLVVLKGSSTVAKAGLSGVTVTERYGAALNGFAAKMSESAAKRLAADPAVAYVEQDQVWTVAATQTNATWGLDRIDQRALPLSTTYTYPRTGTGVRAPAS